MISKRTKFRFYRVSGFSFFILLLPLLTLGKPGAAAIFAGANKQYAKGEYEEAAKGYTQLITAGLNSASVYYNLGNAQYKLNNMAEAILNYERAYKLSPNDADIAANLRFVNQRITDKIEAIPGFFLSAWWHGLLLSFSLSEWATVGVLLSVLGFLLLVVYLFVVGPSLKRAAFYSGIVLIVLAIFSLVMAYSQHAYIHEHQQAIIFNGTVHVKSAPDAGQKTLFVIHEGTKVTLLEHADSWMKVELPNGNVGWIEASAAKEI